MAKSDEVAVRDLRNHTTRVLRRVERGERLRAKSRHPARSIITRESRQIDTPDCGQVCGDLCFDFECAPRSEFHRPRLNGAPVNAKTLNEPSFLLVRVGVTQRSEVAFWFSGFSVE